jgi:hypothetical protein
MRELTAEALFRILCISLDISRGEALPLLDFFASSADCRLELALPVLGSSVPAISRRGRSRQRTPRRGWSSSRLLCTDCSPRGREGRRRRLRPAAGSFELACQEGAEAPEIPLRPLQIESILSIIKFEKI